MAVSKTDKRVDRQLKNLRNAVQYLGAAIGELDEAGMEASRRPLADERGDLLEFARVLASQIENEDLRREWLDALATAD